MKSLYCSLSGFVVAIVGCSGDGLCPVAGTVALDGQPVEGAAVVFVPATGPPSAGRTDAQGRYTLQTLDRAGASVGSHKVSIMKAESIGPPSSEDGSGPPRETKWHIPRRYSSLDSSGLTAEVTKNKTEYNFELTSRQN